VLFSVVSRNGSAVYYLHEIDAVKAEIYGAAEAVGWLVDHGKPIPTELQRFTKPGDLGKVGTPPARRSKGIPRAEAEIRVRGWLAANAKDNPAAITRDAVAAGTGVSAGQVSNTAAWKAFRERRDAETKPGAREVHLSDRMLAVVPSDCELHPEVTALKAEQDAEEAEQDRRHKRRHERRHGSS
jgi:hypothetical protein